MKTPYQLGFEDGFAQPDEFTSGRTFEREEDNEEYDRGVTDGQAAARAASN